MQPYEIIIIIVLALFVVTVFGIRIYKRMHGMPVDECETCHKGVKKMLKKYHKMYGKKCDSHSDCQCQK